MPAEMAENTVCCGYADEITSNRLLSVCLVPDISSEWQTDVLQLFSELHILIDVFICVTCLRLLSIFIQSNDCQDLSSHWWK